MTVTLKYESNNSGGDWWLSDEDWRALEKAGWTVDWFRDQTSEFRHADPDGRWLGALAQSASIDTDDIDAAISDWSAITGQYPDDEGCNCCGNPHSFSYRDENGKYHYRSVVVTRTEGVWT
jgi:hypothetical protein